MSGIEALAPPPFERFYDLSDLGAGGAEISLEANAGDLSKLASFLDVPEVTRFAATVAVKRQAQDRFVYTAVLEADLTQSCVVTLQPVPSQHRLEVSRVLHVIRRARERSPEDEAAGPLSLAAGDDDAPEELDSFRYDLAAPLLEELSLALDPYPRAVEAEFALPEELREEKQSPFAALAKLKEQG